MKLGNFADCLAVLKSAQDREGRIGTDESPIKLTKEEESQLRELGWFDEPPNKSEDGK